MHAQVSNDIWWFSETIFCAEVEPKRLSSKRNKEINIITSYITHVAQPTMETEVQREGVLFADLTRVSSNIVNGEVFLRDVLVLYSYCYKK